MENERFDKLVKSMANGASRRGLIRGLGAGTLAAALGAVGMGAEAAGKKKWYCVCNASGDACKSRKIAKAKGQAKIAAGRASFGKCDPNPKPDVCPSGTCKCDGYNGAGASNYLKSCGPNCHCECGSDKKKGGTCVENEFCGGQVCHSPADCRHLPLRDKKYGPDKECGCVYDDKLSAEYKKKTGTCRVVADDDTDTEDTDTEDTDTEDTDTEDTDTDTEDTDTDTDTDDDAAIVACAAAGCDDDPIEQFCCATPGMGGALVAVCRPDLEANIIACIGSGGIAVDGGVVIGPGTSRARRRR